MNYSKQINSPREFFLRPIPVLLSLTNNLNATDKSTRSGESLNHVQPLRSGKIFFFLNPKVVFNDANWNHFLIRQTQIGFFVKCSGTSNLKTLQDYTLWRCKTLRYWVNGQVQNTIRLVYMPKKFNIINSLVSPWWRSNSKPVVFSRLSLHERWRNTHCFSTRSS